MWIKASERMPEERDWQLCRASGKRMPLLIIPSTRVMASVDGRPYKLDEVEWFDENAKISSMKIASIDMQHPIATFGNIDYDLSARKGHFFNGLAAIALAAHHLPSLCLPVGPVTEYQQNLEIKINNPPLYAPPVLNRAQRRAAKRKNDKK